MKPKPVIQGKRIFLRHFEEEDAGAIKKLSTKEVARWHDAMPYPCRLESVKKWIASTLRRTDSYEYAIILKKNKKLIGGVSFTGMDKKSQYKLASISYWLGKKYWGKGLAKEATIVLINFGFKKLKLKRVYARICEANLPSRGLIESLGFKQEGRLKKHDKDRFGKGWHDRFYYGLLRKHWKIRAI
jgi:RimJ/RimL family protein N-acetyltransferase